MDKMEIELPKLKVVPKGYARRARKEAANATRIVNYFQEIHKKEISKAFLMVEAGMWSFAEAMDFLKKVEGEDEIQS